MKRSGLAMSVLTLTLISVWFAVPAQAESDKWEFVIAPYGLAANITGDAGVGRVDPVPLDVSFGDILESLEFGFMVHGEARKGIWGFIVDVPYMKLGSDISTPLGGVLDAEVNQLIIEAFLARRYEQDAGWIDAYAGIRYWNVDLDLKLDGAVSGALDRGDTWVDPVIGVRIMRNVSDNWFLMARGDIGGFWLGSDFSWNVQGGGGYHFADWFALVGQYRALGVDFENDEEGKSDFFLYDTITHGPLIGLVFSF